MVKESWGLKEWYRHETYKRLCKRAGIHNIISRIIQCCPSQRIRPDSPSFPPLSKHLSAIFFQQISVDQSFNFLFPSSPAISLHLLQNVILFVECYLSLSAKLAHTSSQRPLLPFFQSSSSICSKSIDNKLRLPETELFPHKRKWASFCSLAPIQHGVKHHFFLTFIHVNLCSFENSSIFSTAVYFTKLSHYLCNLLVEYHILYVKHSHFGSLQLSLVFLQYPTTYDIFLHKLHTSFQS